MQKIKTELIDRCRELRTRGYSLGEISFAAGIAKSTIYGHVHDIPLDPKQRRGIEIRRKEKNKNRVNPRKGKCLPGREIIKPASWSGDLVHIVSHFMFDGRIDDDGCIYYSKDIYQIQHMEKLVYKNFHIKPKLQLRDNKVYALIYYNVELAEYIKSCRNKLFDYLNNGASKSMKRVFLRAFFDDEGNVFYKADKRRVRGYQKSLYILEKIKGLLSNFVIEGRINKSSTYIEIGRRDNLMRFYKEINFSPKIFINPKRKNGIWREKISKREILRSLIKSYSIN